MCISGFKAQALGLGKAMKKMDPTRKAKNHLQYIYLNHVVFIVKGKFYAFQFDVYFLQ